MGDPQPRERTDAAEQYARIGKHVTAPKLWNHASDCRADEDRYPN